MSKGTATEVEISGVTLRLGDYVKVKYTTGTWSKGAVLEGEISELWSMEKDGHLQARVGGDWCFHDYDEILEHNKELSGKRSAARSNDSL